MSRSEYEERRPPIEVTASPLSQGPEPLSPSHITRESPEDNRPVRTPEAAAAVAINAYAQTEYGTRLEDQAATNQFTVMVQELVAQDDPFTDVNTYDDGTSSRTRVVEMPDHEWRGTADRLAAELKDDGSPPTCTVDYLPPIRHLGGHDEKLTIGSDGLLQVIESYSPVPVTPSPDDMTEYTEIALRGEPARVYASDIIEVAENDPFEPPADALGNGTGTAKRAATAMQAVVGHALSAVETPAQGLPRLDNLTVQPTEMGAPHTAHHVIGVEWQVDNVTGEATLTPYARVMFTERQDATTHMYRMLEEVAEQRAFADSEKPPPPLYARKYLEQPADIPNIGNLDYVSARYEVLLKVQDGMLVKESARMYMTPHGKVIRLDPRVSTLATEGDVRRLRNYLHNGGVMRPYEEGI